MDVEPRQSEALQAEPPGEPAYNADGVDLTLIRGMLDKTPLERLQTLNRFMTFVRRVRANEYRRSDR